MKFMALTNDQDSTIKSVFDGFELTSNPKKADYIVYTLVPPAVHENIGFVLNCMEATFLYPEKVIWWHTGSYEGEHMHPDSVRIYEAVGQIVQQRGGRWVVGKPEMLVEFLVGLKPQKRNKWYEFFLPKSEPLVNTPKLKDITEEVTLYETGMTLEPGQYYMDAEYKQDVCINNKLIVIKPGRWILTVDDEGDIELEKVEKDLQ